MNCPACGLTITINGFTATCSCGYTRSFSWVPCPKGCAGVSATKDVAPNLTITHCSLCGYHHEHVPDRTLYELEEMRRLFNPEKHCDICGKDISHNAVSNLCKPCGDPQRVWESTKSGKKRKTPPPLIKDENGRWMRNPARAVYETSTAHLVQLRARVKQAETLRRQALMEGLC